MTHASLDRNLPSSRAAASLPYTRHGAAPPPSAVPYDIPAENQEPTIKKKRKRADARQLEALNRMYNRTAFPSTEERLQLARELDMSPRSVQIWSAHIFFYTRCIIPELSTILLGSRTKGSRAAKADEILPTPGLQSTRFLRLLRGPSIFMHNSVPPQAL